MAAVEGSAAIEQTCSAPRVAQPGKGRQRNSSVDIVRGFVLLEIFINHIRNNTLSYTTHKNFGFSDSAEVFVLLAGVAAALAFSHRFDPAQRMVTTKRIIRRIGQLYMAHIAMTLVVAAMFLTTAWALDIPKFARDINLGPLVKYTEDTLPGLFLLTHQLGYVNILPMYMVLLAMLPVIILTSQYSVRLLVLGSLGLWLVAGLVPLQLPNYPNPGGWFFNPFSWQVLFVFGFAGALVWKKAVQPSGWIAILCLGYLVFSFLVVKLGAWSIIPDIGIPRRVWGYDKTFVGLPRLAHALALAYLFLYSPLPGILQKWGSEHPLAVIGRHGLSIFTFGTILSMVFLLVRETSGGGWPLDVLLVGIGCVAHYLLARKLEERKRRAKEREKGQVKTMSATVVSSVPTSGLSPVPSMEG